VDDFSENVDVSKSKFESVVFELFNFGFSCSKSLFSKNIIHLIIYNNKGEGPNLKSRSYKCPSV